MKACKHSQYKADVENYMVLEDAHSVVLCWICVFRSPIGATCDADIACLESILMETHEFLPKEDILRFEEIVHVVQGIDSTRSSKGSPHRR